LLLHVGLLPPQLDYLLVGIDHSVILQLGGGDPLISTSSSEALFSPRLYPVGFFKHIPADTKVCSPEIQERF